MIQSLLKKLRTIARKPKVRKDKLPNNHEVICGRYSQALEACQNMGGLPVILNPKNPVDRSKEGIFSCATYKELRDNFKIARDMSVDRRVSVSRK